MNDISKFLKGPWAVSHVTDHEGKPAFSIHQAYQVGDTTLAANRLERLSNAFVSRIQSDNGPEVDQARAELICRAVNALMERE